MLFGLSRDIYDLSGETVLFQKFYKKTFGMMLRLHGLKVFLLLACQLDIMNFR